MLNQYTIIPSKSLSPLFLMIENLFLTTLSIHLINNSAGLGVSPCLLLFLSIQIVCTAAWKIYRKVKSLIFPWVWSKATRIIPMQQHPFHWPQPGDSNHPWFVLVLSYLFSIIWALGFNLNDGLWYPYPIRVCLKRWIYKHSFVLLIWYVWFYNRIVLLLSLV